MMALLMCYVGVIVVLETSTSTLAHSHDIANLVLLISITLIVFFASRRCLY